MKNVITPFYLVLILLVLSACKKDQTIPESTENNVYRCLMTQYGDQPLTVTEIENSFVQIQWTRHMQGIYFGRLSEPKEIGTLFVTVTQNNADNVQFTINHYQDDLIVLGTKKNGKWSNGLLANTPIEIIEKK